MCEWPSCGHSDEAHSCRYFTAIRSVELLGRSGFVTLIHNCVCSWELLDLIRSVRSTGLPKGRGSGRKSDDSKSTMGSCGDALRAFLN